MGLASSQTWQGFFFFFFNLSWTMHPFGAYELLLRTTSLNAKCNITKETNSIETQFSKYLKTTL